MTSAIGRKGDGGGALIRDWTWFEQFRRRVSHISERDVHRGVSLVPGIQSPQIFSDLYWNQSLITANASTGVDCETRALTRSRMWS